MWLHEYNKNSLKYYCFLQHEYGVINYIRAKKLGFTFYGPPCMQKLQGWKTVIPDKHKQFIVLCRLVCTTQANWLLLWEEILQDVIVNVGRTA